MTKTNVQEQKHRHDIHKSGTSGVDQMLVNAPDCNSYAHGVLTNGPDHNVTWIPDISWPSDSIFCMDTVVATADTAANITQEKANIGKAHKVNVTLHPYPRRNPIR